MRITVITIMVIVIIVTIGVPGMILSLQDIGLGIKTHSFWRERMKKETLGKKRECQKTERPGNAEARKKHMQGGNHWTASPLMLTSVPKQKGVVNSQSTENKKSSDQLKLFLINL